MKLLRPLHRQRTRRRARAVVLSTDALAEHFDIPAEKLELYLKSHAMPYHKDSTGELWMSINVDKASAD